MLGTRQHSFDQLIAEIQTLQGELEQAGSRLRLYEHEISGSRARMAKLQVQLRTTQTLNLGIFSLLEEKQIYALLCESLVFQLEWDSAFVVEVKANTTVIKGSFQATQKQLDHIRDYLSSSQAFIDALAHKHAISTYQSADRNALSLRTLFNTDEVVAMPIQYGQHLFSYMVVCAHTHRGNNRGSEDVDFLASVAAQIGYAVQNSLSYQELEKQNVKLRQLDDLKNSFLSITSHQLRTPLSIIKWILSILQTDKDLKPMSKQLTLIDQAYESNERLIHVVNDLLNVSRIQEGRLPYTPQLTDIAVIIQDLCASAKKASQSKSLRFDCLIEKGLPLLETDPLLIKEAIGNILDNAIDYSQKKDTVKIVVSKSAQKVQIAITNTGFGISQEDQTKIFDQFFRSADAMRAKVNGNGLGLYLTKAIIHEHKGEIHCVSTPGKETTFTITLPIPKN